MIVASWAAPVNHRGVDDLPPAGSLRSGRPATTPSASSVPPPP
jgi:hypothetical protein